MSDTETPENKFARYFGPTSLNGIIEAAGDISVLEKVKIIRKPEHAHLLEDFNETATGQLVSGVSTMMKDSENQMKLVVMILELYRTDANMLLQILRIMPSADGPVLAGDVEKRIEMINRMIGEHKQRIAENEGMMR